MTAEIQIRQRLELYESKIQAGLATFVEVGNALMEIREGKLYRETHGTFEAYCKEKWGMSKMHAHRLMGAAEVTSNLDSNQLVTPSSESQVRPLAHLPPDQQKEVWAKAVEIGGGKPTAKDVQRAVVESTASKTRDEFLATMGVSNAPRLADSEKEDSDPKGLWNLKFHWRQAKRSEKTAFLSWISERGEMQN